MTGAGAWEVKGVLSRGACWPEGAGRRKDTDAGGFGVSRKLKVFLLHSL